MCFMCDNEGGRALTRDYFEQFGVRTHFAKNTTSSDVFGIVDTQPTFGETLLVATADDVPNTITTTRTVQIDGAKIVSTIDTIGDQDFYKVELIGGRLYEFAHYMEQGGPGGVPLADAYLEIYDSTGKLLTNADGGGPNTPNGLDALLTFSPTTSGTYYLNARAFDQNAANGTGGDFVGDYELFARDVTGQRIDTSYKPYYGTDSPLHSIDWGSQVDGTSRNPDGQEGPRVTGNPFTGYASDTFGIVGKNVITVYYAKTGDVFLSQDPANPGLTENIVAKGLQDWEKRAFEQAFDFYEQVADLVFVEVADRKDADFKIITYNGTPGAGASVLGRMNPPNEGNEGQAEFNSGDVRWTEAGLQRGGFYFPTLIHEFGHGLGLAHPHDNGGQSSIMRGGGSTGPAGVIGGGFGDFGLSQQVFTVMSYNKGYALSPYGTPSSGSPTGLTADHYGWVATLGPLDIAVIQDKYGVNEEWATGNDVYTIKDFNAPGNFYEAIWDSGGTDQIVYDGARDANIDLRAATLKYEQGGGGNVSYAFGIHGGFTIANGVTVENARSGSGNDKLIGNAAANKLEGGEGNDTLAGGAGNDTLNGGAGNDTADFSDSDGYFRLDLDIATAQDLRSAGTDTLIGIENVIGGSGANTIYGSAGNNRIEGRDGNDILDGRGGDDILIGGAGSDQLAGRAGYDRFFFEAVSDSAVGSARDKIVDFTRGFDKIDLSSIDAISGTAENDAFTFIGNLAFSKIAGELRYYSDATGTIIAGDVNGDGVADFEIQLTNKVLPTSADFVL